MAVNFDFNLAPESSMEITRDGEPVSVGPVAISSNKMSMSTTIEGEGLPGIYKVSYQACWPFLNCHTGSFAFIVESMEAEQHEYDY